MSKLYLWIEQYLFCPNTLQRIVSILLLPLTMIYCAIVLIKRYVARPQEYGIKIISIGNLIVGGSGKTPISIALAKDMQNVAIILRGYNRKSKGLVIVSDNGKILTDVATSGDEAMLLAQALPNATIIVSEDRVKAITKAKQMGIQIVILDDGFTKSFIKKFDILIKPSVEPTNIYCLPSGGYREPKWLYSKADLVIQEDRDFVRCVKIKNKTPNMVLITSISKPQRLDKFIDKNIAKYYFADHHNFCKEEIEEIINKTNASSILLTTKDYVKVEQFGFVCSIMELDININQNIKDEIQKYIKGDL